MMCQNFVSFVSTHVSVACPIDMGLSMINNDKKKFFI